MTRNSVGPRLRRVVGAAWIAASIALAPAAALAQSGGLAGSLVHLFTSTSTPDGNQAVAGTLYGAAVRFVVQNADGNPSTIGAADRIRFFSIARGASQLQFASPAGATREQFQQWALVKGVTPIDVGYKYSDGGGIRGHSIFLQGHFGF